MHILHIGKFYAPYKGGMETYLKDLCEGLIKDCEVSVIVANTNAKTQKETLNGVHVTRVGSLGNISSNSLCPSMPYWVQKSKADIIHLHFPNPMAHMAYLLGGRGRPLIITWHSDIIRQKKLLLLYRPLLNALLRRANHIITTSENYIHSSQYLQQVTEKCTSVPLGIFLPSFHKNGCNKSKVEEIKKKYGAKPIILFVGRLSAYKGVPFLIKAMKEVDGHLCIVGDGAEYLRLRTVIKESGLEHKITISKDIDNETLLAYYHVCHLFVLPSIERSEAYGIVQLEAMACGKPIVSTDLRSGVPFVNQHKKTGIIVPPKSVSALANAINELLQDEKKRVMYGEFARKRVFELFTVEKMVMDTKAVYENLSHSLQAG